ncbi:MAG: hypothetical protein IE916_00335 [Epsilonproteobacteria bacterium]|nr:hypothetical protein [Campylobacterota bacterium]
MKKTKSLLFAVGVSLMFAGCSSIQNEPDIAVEPIVGMSPMDMGEKHLHTHSLQQTLMRLGLNERFKTYFSPDSDDAFVGYDVPHKWDDAIVKARNNPLIEVGGSGLYGRSFEKEVNIRNNTPSRYSELSKHYTTAKVLYGDVMSGKYIVQTDPSARKMMNSIDFSSSERMRMSYFFDKFYGAIRAQEGKDLYFNLDPKTNIFYVQTQPVFITLTPYKRQYMMNFMDAAGIGYVSNRANQLAIRDNFSNWVTAMNQLSNLNKYKNAVYGIYDGRNWFEISDSHYMGSPITVELIDWIPGGKREYNVYANGYHRKITTDKRFYNFYLPDGSRKYLIRFY